MLQDARASNLPLFGDMTDQHSDAFFTLGEVHQIESAFPDLRYTPRSSRQLLFKESLNGENIIIPLIFNNIEECNVIYTLDDIIIRVHYKKEIKNVKLQWLEAQVS